MIGQQPAYRYLVKAPSERLQTRLDAFVIFCYLDVAARFRPSSALKLSFCFLFFVFLAIRNDVVIRRHLTLMKLSFLLNGVSANVGGE